MLYWIAKLLSQSNLAFDSREKSFSWALFASLNNDEVFDYIFAKLYKNELLILLELLLIIWMGFLITYVERKIVDKT